MTRVSLARIIADELATLRRFDPGARPGGRPRRVVWSEKLPGFGVRYYSTGRSTYIVQALMSDVTRTITLGNANVLSKSQALTVARRILLRAQVGEDPATKRKQARKVPNYDDFLSFYWTQAAAKWKPSTLATHNGITFLLPHFEQGGPNSSRLWCASSTTRVSVSPVRSAYSGSASAAVVSRLCSRERPV